MLKRGLFAVTVLAAGLGIASFVVMTVKDRTYVASDPFAPSGESRRDVAVVYYSRSGHSEAVAREIARMFDAPIARIDADYARDFSGQAKAISDAEANVLPDIAVEPIDLAPARRVYLVSPTWLYRPAPPLWAYVEQAELTGKEVVLVMTGNSAFDADEVEAFGERVRARGGRLVGHVFLERGRIFWQLSREELIEETRTRIGALDRPTQP